MRVILFFFFKGEILKHRITFHCSFNFYVKYVRRVKKLAFFGLFCLQSGEIQFLYGRCDVCSLSQVERPGKRAFFSQYTSEYEPNKRIKASGFEWMFGLAFFFSFLRNIFQDCFRYSMGFCRHNFQRVFQIKNNLGVERFSIHLALLMVILSRV